MKLLVIAAFFAATLALGTHAESEAAQQAFAPPQAPWQQYQETRSDPDLGPPFVAYRLNNGDAQPQQLSVYRLYTLNPHIPLGGIEERILKEYYRDASFTDPKDVALCNGITGYSFSYTADLNHDGHPTLTQEVLAQTVYFYAIIYRRPINEPDDEQAMRALHSLCPPANEPLPTPPPFVSPAQYAAFSAPRGFQLMFGQTENSIGWLRRASAGTSVIALRHQPSLFTSIAEYGADQQRLANAHAATLDGFRHYTLVANRPQSLCAANPTRGWYTEIHGSYYGMPAVEKRLSFMQDDTIYSADYLRPDAVPEDRNALLALRSLCPRSRKTPSTAETVKPRFMSGTNLTSEQTVANSAATQRWVAEHIVPGMTRAGVESSLSAKGIKATTQLRKINCFSDGSIETRWWYQGTYPENECASPDFATRPVISINLPGPFEPWCSFSSYLDVLFDEHDRVQMLALSNPIPDCL